MRQRLRLWQDVDSSLMAPPEPAAPYVSLVATARNDDHGGNLLGRMQVFIDAWINQCKRHGLDSELILVEWNPPPDRDRLDTALRWPADTSPCQVRIITVPPELHARYHHSAALPLYQMIAKNVGIRRARGEFILPTNIDIVFSDELVAFLASRQLEKGRMYRIDRHDVMSDVPIESTLDQQLEYCRGHLIRLCAREGTFAMTQDGVRQNEQSDITPAHSGLSFGEGWGPTEPYANSCERFRWVHGDAQILARVPEGGAVLLLEVEPGPGVDSLPQPLQVLDENGSTVAEWKIAGRTTLALAVPASQGSVRRSFWLRVPGGGRPVLSDPRILNLAVFRCDWAETNPPKTGRTSVLSVVEQNRVTLQRLLGACRRFGGIGALLSDGPRTIWRAIGLLSRRGSDIFEAGLDFQLGPGWFYLEEAEGERFRWASKEAQLALRMPAFASRLALLVEPGPGMAHKPFGLVIRHLDDNSTLVHRAVVRGLTYVEFSVKAEPGKITTLSMTPDREGLPGEADPRLLNFRVLACGAGAQRDAVALMDESSAASKWPSLRVDSRPATMNWNAELEPFRRQIDTMGKPAFLHTFACGDFTMMAREHWFDLRGYAELDVFSMHLDSMLCYASYHAGVREELLREPMRIYHIEHAVGTGWTPEGQAQLEARIARKGIKSLFWEDMGWMIMQMRTLHAPLIFNLEDWGLAKENLPEISFSPPLAARKAGP
jgi:hypothetical protein